MKKSLGYFFIFALTVMSSLAVKAQLATATGFTADSLATLLAGDNVEVTDVTSNCYTQAIGTFDCIDCNVGIDSGIILTSGKAMIAEGPNNNGGAGYDNYFPGDADLTSLAGLTTHNACVLEFDVTPKFDTLKFDYVFGSDEYLEYVFGYNDIFAFFISGPGIVGTQNIALVPGTTTPVSIFNVNNVSNPEYYVDNGTGYTPPYSTDPYYIQYDGFTTVLTAVAVVEPCETYHLKLAVADAVDGILDSGVFLKSRSLTSSGIHLSQTTSVGDGFLNAIEGCVDAYVIFTADNPPPVDQTVHFVISGTATDGTDYTYVPDSIVIPAGGTSDSVLIHPIADGITEGFESVTIYLVNDCDGEPYDSVTLNIQDEVDLNVVLEPDTTICPGDSILLTASGGLDYFWDPGTYISTTSGDSVYVFPPVTGDYHVSSTLGTCTGTDTATVQVATPPDADIGPDVTICLGDSHTFSVSAGNSYEWDPPTYLDNPGIYDPTATPDTIGSIAYFLVVTDMFGCQNFDTVVLHTNADPVITQGPDTLVCPGQPVPLYATGGVIYSWYPTTGISDPTSSNPVASTETSQIYNVIVIDATGCDDTGMVDIEIDPFPDVDAGPLVVINEGESTVLQGTSSVTDNLWTPPDFLSDPTILNPIANPDTTTWYYLTATSPIGCQSLDSVHVVVIPKTDVIIPNAFTPNGDGVNDLMHIITFKDVTLTSFTIYDRWGQMVYQTNDINAGWDGTFLGKPQEVGTYLYIFVGKDPYGKDLTLQGTINLLR